MSQLSVSSHLLSNYEDYCDGDDTEWRLGAVDKANNIISLCENVAHDSIIEIGAGEGSILKRLDHLNFGKELFALEISRGSVQLIKDKGISKLAKCSLFDGYSIPHSDAAFDLAVLSHVIEHVEYPRKLLFEATRVAKFVFVEVPLEDNMRLSHEFVLTKTGHINFYSLKTIRRLLQSCNLRILGQETTNPSKDTYTFGLGKKGLVNYYVKEGLLRLNPRLATSMFCYHTALVCQAGEFD